jgi:hypothetical protein
LYSNIKIEKSVQNKGVRAMVFNATFNIISVISWQSALLVEETGGPGEQCLMTQTPYLVYIAFLNVNNYYLFILFLNFNIM